MKRLSGIGLRRVLTLELHALRRRLALSLRRDTRVVLAVSLGNKPKALPDRNSCRIRPRISRSERTEDWTGGSGDEKRPSAAQNQSNAASRTASASFPDRGSSPDRRSRTVLPQPDRPRHRAEGKPPPASRVEAGGLRGRREILSPAEKCTASACRPTFCGTPSGWATYRSGCLETTHDAAGRAAWKLRRSRRSSPSGWPSARRRSGWTRPRRP